MERKFLIIPEIDRIQESVELSSKYHVAFEYNDFFNPLVYEDEKEVERRCKVYKSFQRDRSEDTLHGVFMDVALNSKDQYLREYSRKRIWQSMEIADCLGVRGVVFHSGLIAGLEVPTYLDSWLEGSTEFWDMVAKKYHSLEVYVENTLERTPDMLVALKKNLKDVSNFKLCLDYGHAVLTGIPIEHWVGEMASKIGHIHLNDNDLKRDMHQVPGDGSIDFQQCKSLFDKYGIDLPILLEINGIENQAKALEYVKKINFR